MNYYLCELVETLVLYMDLYGVPSPNQILTHFTCSHSSSDWLYALHYVSSVRDV